MHPSASACRASALMHRKCWPRKQAPVGYWRCLIKEGRKSLMPPRKWTLMDAYSSPFVNVLLWYCHPFDLTLIIPRQSRSGCFLPFPQVWKSHCYPSTKMLPSTRQSLPGSPQAIPLRLFLLEIYSIAYSTAILQCTGTRSRPSSPIIALSSFSRTILDKTPNHRLAAPVTVLYVLPAQYG